MIGYITQGSEDAYSITGNRKLIQYRMERLTMRSFEGPLLYILAGVSYVSTFSYLFILKAFVSSNK